MYSYLYFHLYSLASSIRKQNARESAILYLSAIISFFTSPLIIYFIPQAKSNIARFAFIIFIAVYFGLVFVVNKKYFEDSERLKKIYSKFRSESRPAKILGHIVAVFTLILSVLSFVVLLTLIKQ